VVLEECNVTQYGSKSQQLESSKKLCAKLPCIAGLEEGEGKGDFLPLPSPSAKYTGGVLWYKNETISIPQKSDKDITIEV